jgi:heavy-metal-associated domain-containing protein
LSLYVHNVHGRLRIKNPAFKNADLHYEVKKALVNMGHGIGTADFNTTTGSLLIHYDPREINHQDILNSLDRAGFVVHGLGRRRIMEMMRMMRDIPPLFLTKDFWRIWVGLIALCLVIYMVVKG